MIVLLTQRQAREAAAVVKAASTDQARPILCGVQVEWEARKDELEMRLVTTDSYRLAIRRFIIRHEVELVRYQAEGKGNVLIRDGKAFADALLGAAKAAKAKAGALSDKSPLGKVALTIEPIDPGSGAHRNDRQLILVSDVGQTYKAQLEDSDGTFPNYKQLTHDLDDLEASRFTPATELGCYNVDLLIGVRECMSNLKSDRGKAPVRMLGPIKNEAGDLRLQPAAWWHTATQGTDRSDLYYLIAPVRIDEAKQPQWFKDLGGPTAKEKAQAKLIAEYEREIAEYKAAIEAADKALVAEVNSAPVPV